MLDLEEWVDYWTDDRTVVIARHDMYRPFKVGRERSRFEWRIMRRMLHSDSYSIMVAGEKYRECAERMYGVGDSCYGYRVVDRGYAETIELAIDAGHSQVDLLRDVVQDQIDAKAGGFWIVGKRADPKVTCWSCKGAA